MNSGPCLANINARTVDIAILNETIMKNSILWNPFIKGTSGKGASLACFSPDNLETSRAVCDSLDLYTAGATPYASVN